MRPDALLALAATLLQRVLAFEHPADRVVAAFCREHRALGPRERHALAETTYAVLRERLLWRHLAQGGPGTIERRLAMLAWQGDATLLRAALTEDERRWLDGIGTPDRAALPERLRHNLPDWLAERLRERLGDEFWPLAECLNTPAPLDLRVNAMKGKRDDVRAALARSGIEAVPTPYAPLGLRVAGKPSLARIDVWERGEVDVQDEGSQLLALLVEPKRGEMVADFCAGAGGKTLALGAAMRSTGRLYAFDTSGHRLAALEPRLARSGLTNVHPVQIAHERDERIQRLVAKLDRVLVDAPCSGLGTLRRNPDLKWRVTPAAIDEMVQLQRRILAAAATLVKPGGRLVYATCSLLDAENEAVVADFEAAHAPFRRIAVADVLRRSRVPHPDSLVAGDALRLWPHRHQTDGFYATIWQRP